MGEERFNVPCVFDRNLREQQSTSATAFDDEAVAADLHVTDGAEFLCGRQQRELDQVMLRAAAADAFALLH
jgi:hypothetical protein